MLENIEMTEHERRAAELFLNGGGCAQAVFCAFCDLHGIDEDTSARLASSMGGGVGRMRQVCGAVSGAAMAAGLIYGFPLEHTHSEKSEHYKRIQEISAVFPERFGSIVCKDILASRLGAGAVSSAPVPEERSADFYKRRPCLECVRLAARSLDEYLAAHPIEKE